MTMMHDGAFSLHEDRFLSEIFGYDCFRLKIEKEGDAERQCSRYFKEKLKNKCFAWSKINFKDYSLINFLFRNNFVFICEELTFLRLPGPANSVRLGSSVDIIPADDTHREEIGRIATEAFEYSRFHLDGKITDYLSGKIKAIWVDNFFKGTRGNMMYVAIKEGTICGFNLVIETSGELVIDLIAVDRCFRNIGIASAFINELIPSGKKILAGTQAVNHDSINLYIKNGFRCIDTTASFHYHFSP
jgi:GNAT superfamily N-acetyltransferase